MGLDQTWFGVLKGANPDDDDAWEGDPIHYHRKVGILQQWFNDNHDAENGGNTFIDTELLDQLEIDMVADRLQIGKTINDIGFSWGTREDSDYDEIADAISKVREHIEFYPEDDVYYSGNW